MNLALGADKGDETIVGRDVEMSAYASTLELVDGLDWRRHVDDLACDHVVVIEALVS